MNGYSNYQSAMDFHQFVLVAPLKLKRVQQRIESKSGFPSVCSGGSIEAAVNLAAKRDRLDFHQFVLVAPLKRLESDFN